MGQYWLPVNLDKKEYIHPHELGSGLKLWEIIANNSPGVGAALVVLTAAQGEGSGGGDLEDADVIGRWRGDRIAIVGDYAGDSNLPEEFEASTIYDRCSEGEFKNISHLVAEVLEYELQGKFSGGGWRDWSYDREE